MEWIGFLSFIILLCYAGYPDKVRKLEHKVKKLESKQKGVSEMSKIISELSGKKCIITTSELLQFVGDTKITCDVLEVDDEWIKFSYTDKKKNTNVKIMRIDNISGIEILEEKENKEMPLL